MSARLDKDEMRLKARWMPCPNCGNEWPFPKVQTPHTDLEIDWTCNVCLHAQVARLQRQVVMLERVVSSSNGTRDE